MISLICVIISGIPLGYFMTIPIGGGPEPGYESMFWAMASPILIIFILLMLVFIVYIYKLIQSRK